MVTFVIKLALIFILHSTAMAKYSFVPFTIIVIVLFLVLFFYMPETKEASVNEIESLFQVRINVFELKSFVNVGDAQWEN